MIHDRFKGSLIMDIADAGFEVGQSTIAGSTKPRVVVTHEDLNLI